MWFAQCHLENRRAGPGSAWLKNSPRNSARNHAATTEMNLQKSDEVNAHTGWLKAMRTEDAMELIAANPLAYTLAAVIAFRARWRDGFNRHGLGPGEAMLGDFKKCGMSIRQYRTAKENLQKWGFATFRTTNKGTIGKLIDTRLFSVYADNADNQNAMQPTSSRQASVKQPTTNEERIDSKNGRTKERLNDASGQSDGGKGTPALPVHRLSASMERELMARLRTLLGDDEMRCAGGNWRVTWVRPFPQKVEAALNDLESQIKEGKTIHNRAAWLVDLLKRWTKPKT